MAAISKWVGNALSYFVTCRFLSHSLLTTVADPFLFRFLFRAWAFYDLIAAPQLSHPLPSMRYRSSSKFDVGWHLTFGTSCRGALATCLIRVNNRAGVRSLRRNHCGAASRCAGASRPRSC
jgi:hypothetical protein